MYFIPMKYGRFGRVKVTLTPLGDRIKFFVRGSRLFCQSMKNEIQRSMTLDKDDWMWRNIFGSKLAIKKFLDRGKPKTIITTLSSLGYDRCDSSGKHKQHTREYE